MNILFVSHNFAPERNAIASRVYERACYWVRWGHRVTVMTCVPNFPEGKVHPGYTNRWAQTEEMTGIRVIRVRTLIAANQGTVLRIASFLTFMAAAFCAGLFVRKPDVVVVTSPQFFAAVGGWAVSFLRRVPFVLEVSDMWPASVVAVGAMKAGAWLRFFERVELFLYRRSAAVVALTRSFKEDMVRRGIRAEKIAVVINGVDLPRFSARPRDRQLAAALGLRASHFVVGYIGTHGMAHALENVLEAAELLRCSEARLLFVGPGAARERLVTEAARRNLDNVIFAPAQLKERLPAYWSLCDLALVHLKNAPLFATVIPSKIFEAMAMGLPILLAAPSGEASRIVLEEGAGVCVPAERPDALAELILRLSANAPLREQLAAASLAAAPRFSRERQAKDMLGVLIRVVTGQIACEMPDAVPSIPRRIAATVGSTFENKEY